MRRKQNKIHKTRSERNPSEIPFSHILPQSCSISLHSGHVHAVARNDMNSLSWVTPCQPSKVGRELCLLKPPCRWSEQVDVTSEGAGEVCVHQELVWVSWYRLTSSAVVSWLLVIVWTCLRMQAVQSRAVLMRFLKLTSAVIWSWRLSAKTTHWNKNHFPEMQGTKTYSVSFNALLWSRGAFEFLFTYKRFTVVQNEFLEKKDSFLRGSVLLGLQVFGL